MEPSDEDLVLLAKAFRFARLNEVKRANLTGYFSADELIALFRAVCKESDRSAALMVTSYVEEILRRAFSMHLNADVEGGVKGLLEGNGPLSTFSDRIKLAHALGWIEKDQASEINQLRKIRNVFAHEFRINTFSEKPIVDHLNTIRHYEDNIYKWLDEDGHKYRRAASGRELFVLRSLGLLANVIIMLGTAPTLIKNGLLPCELVVDGHLNPDEAAPIFRAVHYAAVSVALDVVNAH